MNRLLPKHEKIRFRRHEISELSTFPSAEGQGHLMRRSGAGRRLLRALAVLLTIVTSMFVLTGAAAYLWLANGLDTRMVAEQAEAAIRDLSGFDVSASVGSARISLDGSQFFAVSLPDVSLRKREGGEPLLDAASVDFGVRAMPLLSGTVQLGSARVSQARIHAAVLEGSDSSDWAAAIRNTDGLIDPDLFAPVLFDAVHRIYDALGVGTTRSLELDEVDLILEPGSGFGNIRFDRVLLAQPSVTELKLEATVTVDGRILTIYGEATRDPQTERVTALNLHASLSPPDRPENAPPADTLGEVELQLSGTEGDDGSPSRLALEASIGRSTFVIDHEDHLDGEIDLAVSITTGENKARVEKLLIRQGRSLYHLFGPVGPRPVTTGEPPAYRFELASDRSISSPEGSTEPALPFSLRLAGTFDPAASRLHIPTIALRTDSGDLNASIAIDFKPGGPPGVDLAVLVPQMSTAHVKQLWPFTAAGKARLWAMKNLFGGRVSNGHVMYRVPPGRIGNGVPLNGDEVSARFDLSGVRFDIAGDLPPMRDAAGTIEVSGNDVDVKLASGAVFLPSGGSVSAANGVFTIRDAYKPVVIGQLDIDVSGDAASVAQLASYEPLDALARTGLTPDQFSGKISGRVSAQIPLVGDVDTRSLAWRVLLDFSDLDLAKPIEDQLVSQATGSIELDPDKAVVKARARLNAAPAEIVIVEPLRPAGPKPSLEVTLTLDDKAREALAPGLGEIVKGPVEVSFSGGESGRKVKARLTDAIVELPWVGWSKGKGVPADVEFSLTKSDAGTRLDDFSFAGKTFSVTGTIALASGGGLSSAKFNSVRLNRGDEARVTVERTGKGFDIAVSGASLDVRALIKTLKAKDESPVAGTQRISISARLGRMIGFNDEVMSDVSLTFAGSGTQTGQASFTATTATGATVSMRDETSEGRRTIEMSSRDAGAVLRFLDIYEHMVGGSIKFTLSGPAGGTLAGQVDATNFQIVDEPKLRSIVSGAPADGGRSLSEAIDREIDTSRVTFERGYAGITKGDGSLVLTNGVLRGSTIGSTFQGTLYDKAGRIEMTGTFMPAYGLNRIFGELPLVGTILGNGRDRGLIGVTFKLTGDATKPTLQINPLSVIAPGIFRSIFEYR